MAVLKETRSFRPFKSSEEYLYAMKEDLAEWLNMLYPELIINVDNFMDRLDTGVALCKHANAVRKSAEEYLVRRAARKMSMSSSTISTIALPITDHGAVHFLKAAKAGTFFARDNVSNFIDWCRRGLGVFECLLFETDDLIMRKNEKHVILCLLDVARRGAKFGMLAPMLVQLEREIDREIAAEQRALQRGNSCENTGYVSEEEDELEQEEYNVQYGPMPQIITNDLKSLDEMVRELVERCHCPVQFPMIRVSEGKYRIGDTKVLIFVRILRNHVMVRVGGGWDTLSHYLDKHDPCRCKTAHRSPLSTKLILKNGGTMELNHAQVHYERSPPRTRRSSTSSISSGGRPEAYTLNTPNLPGRTRSRSPAPRRSLPKDNLAVATPSRARSRSPTPKRNLQPSNGRTTPRNRSRSPNPRSPSKKPATPVVVADDLEATTKAENDSGSEVSDEGYRSLGMVIVTSQPEKSSTKVIVNGEERTMEKRGSMDSARSKRTSFSSTYSTDEAPPPGTLITIADDETDSLMQVDACPGAQFNSATPRRSLPDSPTYGKENTPEGAKRSAQKTSLPADPRRSTPSPVPTRATAQRITRRRSIDNGEQFDEPPPQLSPRKSPVYRSLKADPRTERPSSLSRATGRQTPTTNTWSSRAKQRPALTSNTFTNTQSKGSGGGFGPRNSYQRSSLGSSPSTPIRKPSSVKGQSSVSLNTSPTKEISPLVKQILDVNDLGDDEKVLDKMREIIQHYKDIVDERLLEEGKCEVGSRLPQGPELDFTSTWVHNNGTLQGIQHGGAAAADAVKTQASPRKDSKNESFSSKIPAPVGFASKIPAPIGHRSGSIVSRDS